MYIHMYLYTGMGFKSEAKSSSLYSRNHIFVTRNGKCVNCVCAMPSSLAKVPLSLHPVVALSTPGDFISLDVQSSPPDALQGLVFVCAQM